MILVFQIFFKFGCGFVSAVFIVLVFCKLFKKNKISILKVYNTDTYMYTMYAIAKMGTACISLFKYLLHFFILFCTCIINLKVRVSWFMFHVQVGIYILHLVGNIIWLIQFVIHLVSRKLYHMPDFQFCRTAFLFTWLYIIRLVYLVCVIILKNNLISYQQYSTESDCWSQKL